MGVKLKAMRACCPVCNSKDKVYIYDHGFKFWRRLFAGNNRLACRNCMVTWRRKEPYHQAYLQKKENTVTHTQGISRPYVSYFVLLSKVKKSFWTYSIFGVFSAIAAYLIISFFSHNSGKLVFRPSTETRAAGQKSKNVSSPRNDKMSGTLELQKRGIGNKK